MIQSIISHVLAFVIQGNPLALGALFLVAAFTEVGVPFPFLLDTVLLLSGYHNGVLSWPVLLLIVSLFLGRVAGSSIIFLLSRWLGKRFVAWLERRRPSLGERMDKLSSRFQTNAAVAVAAARLTPGLLTVSTVACGTFGVKYWLLVLGIALASLVSDGAELIVGFLTRSGTRILGIQPAPWQLILLFVVLLGMFGGLRYVIERRRAKKLMDANKP